MTKPYKLEIWHDPDTERPDEYGIGRMVSFGNRHINYEDPDLWLADQTECLICDGDGWERVDGERGEGSCEPCEGYGYTTAVHNDVLATLAYYEHGLCRWSVGESVVPDYGGFDTVQLAGVIVWNGDDNEREWWNDELDDVQRRKILESIAETYTEWANGETYGYTLTSQERCGECLTTRINEVPYDSCGGFVGVDHLVDHLRDELHASDIDPSDIETGGEFGYVLHNFDLTPTNGLTNAGAKPERNGGTE